MEKTTVNMAIVNLRSFLTLKFFLETDPWKNHKAEKWDVLQTGSAKTINIRTETHVKQLHEQ